MNTTVDSRELKTGLERLDRLLKEAEQQADPASWKCFEQIVQALLELHGAGLERIMDHVQAAGAAGHNILDACTRDEVVGGLLLLHGVHPLEVNARVQQALDSVRPYLASHGGDVELIDLRDGIVRLRLNGSCHSCPSSTATMQQTVEEAIYGRAPEVTSIEVEGLAEPKLPAEIGQARFALPLV